MNLQQLTQQYRGATLAKLIENQIRAMSEDQLLVAIRGTYDTFLVQFRPSVDSYTLSNAQEHWFRPQMNSADLSDLFSQSIANARTFASSQGVDLTDDQAFDIFNITVMRLSHFAHSRPEFRKQMGIKNGWFSQA
jgi:hypothetical protein